MRDLDSLFAALADSRFRARFRVDAKDRAYLERKGLPLVLDHATDFVARRLAPAQPLNDGKQTPMRGHPVFVAQHATASCCRNCLAKWHAIPAGRGLSDAEQRHVVDAIERWLRQQLSKPANADKGTSAAPLLPLDWPEAIEMRAILLGDLRPAADEIGVGNENPR